MAHEAVVRRRLQGYHRLDSRGKDQIQRNDDERDRKRAQGLHRNAGRRQHRKSGGFNLKIEMTFYNVKREDATIGMMGGDHVGQAVVEYKTTEATELED